jgi:hypothetical protein
MEATKKIISPKLTAISIRMVVVLILFLVPSSSCNLIDRLFVDCSNCYSDIPLYGEQSLRVSIDDENPEVTITVYIGPWEKGNVEYIFTMIENEQKIVLRTDVHYTLIAEYTKNGRTYNVVNGSILKVQEDYDSCDEPCYYVSHRSVDLRLKF